MRKDKEEAFKLRREGKSYREIRTTLRVPLATLSEWFANEEWSVLISQNLAAKNALRSKIRITELGRVRGAKLRALYEEARTNAEKEFLILKEDPLFVAGVVAYWGEGDKVNKYLVRLSNTDPKIVLLFKRFLTFLCNVPEEKITCWLLLYPDLDDETCKKYWSEATSIPLSNFKKSMVIQGRHKTKRLSYGVGNVVVSSRYLKEKMLIWLRLLAEEKFAVMV